MKVTRLDLDERELTLELFTVENELDLSSGNFVARIVAFGQRIRALIPNDDAPRAVLPGGNVSLEIAVVERMILDVHCQAAVTGREGRAFRHGPRSQNAVGLEPEIVVQSRGAMHLNHEAHAFRRARRGRRSPARLGRLREIALLMIRRQRARTHRLRLRLLL